MEFSLSTLTDFYELTMAQTYFDAQKSDMIAYFDLFYRRNPYDGGYAIMGGLDEIIDFVKDFHFNEKDIESLRKTGSFSEAFLDYLSKIRFSGDIYAIEDGTPIFPNEPIITVKAPIIEAQLIETAILTCFNHAALVSSVTRRIINEADGVPVMEFGARRARGIASSLEASKYSYIAGCVGTSNVLAGLKYDIPLLGTMAHSMVEAFDDEYEAFLAYAKSNSDNATFLIDTYDTLNSGLVNAMRVAKDYLIPNGYKLKGVRIDSGDLIYLAKKCREILDENGFTDTGICLSNGLNEYRIADLRRSKVPVNSFGVGDNIAASKERMDGVYKLVAIETKEGIKAKIKISEDTVKTINPGFKKLYRFFDLKTNKLLGDLIAMHDEVIPLDHYTLVSDRDPWKKTELSNYRLECLQKTIFKDGELVYERPDIEKRRAYSKECFKSLSERIVDIYHPHTYYVDLSVKEKELKDRLILEKTRRIKNV